MFVALVKTHFIPWANRPKIFHFYSIQPGKTSIQALAAPATSTLSTEKHHRIFGLQVNCPCKP